VEANKVKKLLKIRGMVVSVFYMIVVFYLKKNNPYSR